MCQNWSERQKKIYEGLKNIGGEAAAFFKSALECYYSDSFPNKANFLAHAAREIDGGIRDIFYLKKTKKKEKGANKKSIFAVLNDKERENLAKEWLLIAGKLHKYAHRHGIWKPPRKFEEFEPLWDKYEEILLKLVGSFYAIINRIDKLTQLETISEAACGTLLNLVRIDIFEEYFFQKVKSISWFLPLVTNKVFEPTKIRFDNEGNALFWNVLYYLEWISAQLNTLAPQDQIKYARELIKIIDDTVNYSLELKEKKSEKKINNMHIWWFFVKIINNIPTEVIVKEKRFDVTQVKKWLGEFLDPALPDSLALTDATENLLPKFLDREETIKFAEVIIDLITAIRKSDKVDVFTKQREPVLVYDPYWVLEAFRKYGRKIGQVCSLDIVYILADRLNLVLKSKRQSSSIDIRVENDRYRIKVERVEKQNLKESEIGFEESKYRVMVSQFSRKQLKNADFDEDIWSLITIEPEIQVSQFSISAKNKEMFIEQIKNNLPGNINWQNAKEFVDKIDGLFERLYEDYSNIWCRSLKRGPEHTSSADEILTDILRNILPAKCESNREEGDKVLNAFLVGEYKFPIFKRFVIWCVDMVWGDYRDWIKVIFEKVPDVFKGSKYEMEIFDLLQNHSNELDSKAITKIKELLDDIPPYWKYKWYSALRENEEFKAPYREIIEKVKPKDNKPYNPKYVMVRTGWITDKSPLSKEQILEMPIAGLIKFLHEFKDPESCDGTLEGAPNREGLAKTLREAVKESPERFVRGIDSFYNAPYIYVDALLAGLKDAFNAGKDFIVLWDEVLKFSLRYVKKTTFLQEACADNNSCKYISVIDNIVGLIKVATVDNSRSYRQEHIGIIKQIFDTALTLTEVALKPDIQLDVLTYSINTTFGRIVESFILFSLWVKRVAKQEEVDWGKNNYEKFFERNGIEAWLHFGLYLPNIMYLDKRYVEEKVSEFLKYDVSDLRWQGFMEGYLSSRYVYDDAYELMRAHYEKAIENKVLSEDVDYHLVQHICIGYLRGHEVLKGKNSDGKDSLFWKILDDADEREKHDRWIEVVRFFWSISARRIEERRKEEKEAPSDEVKKKILEFWEWVFNNREYVKGKLKEDYEKFLAKLADLTVYLDKIDEKSKDWIMLSAPYVYGKRHVSFFIDYLTKFQDDESLKYIGKIFLKILKSPENTTPTYRQEDIQLIIERLYKLWQRDKEKYKEVKDDADEICNTYGRRGVYFLREVWDKYN